MSYDPELVDLSLIEDFPDEFPEAHWVIRSGKERRVQRIIGLVRERESEYRSTVPDAREIGHAIARQAHQALTEKVMRSDFGF